MVSLVFGAIFVAIGLSNFPANNQMFWLVFPDRTPPLGRKMRIRESRNFAGCTVLSSRQENSLHSSSPRRYSVESLC
jgi:hypothetical protein